MLVQDLTSAVLSFGSHLPRFIKTITSLQSVGVPDSIPVSNNIVLLLITSKWYKLIELNMVHNYYFHFQKKTVEKAVEYVVIFCCCCSCFIFFSSWFLCHVFVFHKSVGHRIPQKRGWGGEGRTEFARPLVVQIKNGSSKERGGHRLKLNWRKTCLKINISLFGPTFQYCSMMQTSSRWQTKRFLFVVKWDSLWSWTIQQVWGSLLNEVHVTN